MKDLKPTCSLGKYGKGMKIYCKKDGMLCGFQFYRSCKGWWANTENAAKCLKKEENK